MQIIKDGRRFQRNCHFATTRKWSEKVMLYQISSQRMKYHYKLLKIRHFEIWLLKEWMFICALVVSFAALSGRKWHYKGANKHSVMLFPNCFNFKTLNISVTLECKQDNQINSSLWQITTKTFEKRKEERNSKDPLSSNKVQCFTPLHIIPLLITGQHTAWEISKLIKKLQ